MHTELGINALIQKTISPPKTLRAAVRAKASKKSAVTRYSTMSSHLGRRVREWSFFSRSSSSGQRRTNRTVRTAAKPLQIPNQKVKNPGPTLLLSLVWMGTWFIAATNNDSVWFWMVGMFAANIANPAVLTVAAGLIQFLTPADLQGRVMGIWMMFSFGIMPFGALCNGFLSGAVGVVLSILIFRSVLILMALCIALIRRPLWSWIPHAEGGKNSI
jgi:MFS family permease